MQIYHDIPDQPLDVPSHLTIGSFDGVHCGHQMLIREMVNAAHLAGQHAAVMTFDPHPLAVLRPDIPLAYLTTPEERTQILAALGVDYVVILPFSKTTASTSAEDFVRTLVDRLRLHSLWIGPDFALGRGREGNVERLSALGQQYGYHVHVMPVYDVGAAPVRSSRVRTLLADQGDVAQAAELLGRQHQIWGEVERGAGRGRGLGFPTANLTVPRGRLIPAHGVYACWAWLEADGPDGRNAGRPAAVSIGVRPTFDNGHPSVEAYLLDYEGDLYGQTVGLSFVQRLRSELRFSTVGDLIEQMKTDVDATRAILSDPRSDAVAGPEGWEEIPHTADWAIRLQARTQGELFARAAGAMFHLQDARPYSEITLARSLSVRAQNPSELLVAWLSRLLLYQELDSEMYSRFRILEISHTGLNGIAYGYPGRPAHTAVKAITYYDLSVAEKEDGWTATVTFDV